MTTVDALVEPFAVEAVLAWHRLEGSSTAHDASTSFERAWNGVGLGEVDLGREPADADPETATGPLRDALTGAEALRIMQAARDIIERRAQSRAAGEGEVPLLTVEAATNEAFGRGGAPAGNDARSEEILKGLATDPRMYGGSLPEPGDWLDESMARLAKAAAVRDVMRSGAQAQPGRADLEQADTLVRLAQRLDANHSDVAARAVAARRAGRDGYPGAVASGLLMGGAVGLVTSPALHQGPLPVRIVTGVAGVACALWVAASTKRADRDARAALHASLARLGDIRVDLIRDLGPPSNASAPSSGSSLGARQRRPEQPARPSERDR
jgi:hypothetical protein